MKIRTRAIIKSVGIGKLAKMMTIYELELINNFSAQLDPDYKHSIIKKVMSQDRKKRAKLLKRIIKQDRKEMIDLANANVLL